MTFDELTERFGGVVATHQLLAAGETAVSIRDACRSGTLSSIRHGWYRTEPPIQKWSGQSPIMALSPVRPRYDATDSGYLNIPNKCLRV